MRLVRLGGLGNLHWRLIALFIARYSPVPLLIKPTLIPLDPDDEAAKMVSVYTTLTDQYTPHMVVFFSLLRFPNTSDCL